jgi:hypothetical protein
MTTEQMLREMFGDLKPKESTEDAYRRGLLKGFILARDRIAKMLDEEGKGVSAGKVRKMELVKR